jgi:threonine efflux protein
METSLLLASGFAGFVYGITPGPAVLLVFGLTASQGRRAGAAFLSGHFVGDIVWVTLALVAIVGARTIGSAVFDVLGVLCGLYLGWLGFAAVTARRRSDGTLETTVRRPLVRGILFGLTNPKGYPVAIATFTAILASYATGLSWAGVPGLLAAAAAGFVASYAVIVAVTGLGFVRRFYRRHELWIVRLSGLLFIGFAVHAITTSASGLLGRRG